MANIWTATLIYMFIHTRRKNIHHCQLRALYPHPGKSNLPGSRRNINHEVWNRKKNLQGSGKNTYAEKLFTRNHHYSEEALSEQSIFRGTI